MFSKPVALVFGSGPNIGAAVIKKFVEAGYRVAAVSRNAAQPPTLSSDGTVLPIQADLTQPSQVPAVFETVNKTWNTFPKVIIWNVGRLSPSPDKSNIFSVSIANMQTDLAIAVTSSWAAANEAVKNWKEGENGIFIYTGNLMAKAVFPHPDFTTLGVSKRGTSYWLAAADSMYKDKGWRFYYADERSPEGKSVGKVPGAESHAEMYLQLAESKEDFSCYVTFVNGKYREF